MNKRKKIILIASIVCVAVIGTFVIKGLLAEKANTGSTDSIVTAAVLEKKDLIKTVSANGVVASRETTKITTALTTNVKELNVSIGQKVKKSDVLCVLDDTAIKADIAVLESQIEKSDTAADNQHTIHKRALSDAQADQTRLIEKANRDIQAAQAQVNAAAADVAAKKNNLDAINANLAAAATALDAIKADTSAPDYQNKVTAQEAVMQQLQTDKAAAEEALATANSNLTAAQNALNQANDSLKSTQADTNKQIQSAKDAITTEGTENSTDTQQTELEKQKANLEKTVIKAPIDGTVTAIKAEVNFPVSGGTVMLIENTDAKKISVQISENDILKIKEGMKAVITSDAVEGKEYTGKVSEIFTTPVTDSDTKASDTSSTTASKYLTEISFDNADKNILLGMHVKVKIILEESKDIYAVPYEAVITDENGISKIYAAVVDEKGNYTAKSFEVQKGIETDYYAAVSGDGLQDGMMIITSGGMADGQTVALGAGDTAVPSAQLDQTIQMAF